MAALDFEDLTPKGNALSFDDLTPGAKGLIPPAPIQSQESGSQGDLAVSPRGARGAMQVMGPTSRDPGFGVTPARDNSPEELDRVGTDYWAALQKHFQNPYLAMAAYNAGPGVVEDWINGTNVSGKNDGRLKLGDPRRGDVTDQDFVSKIPYGETRNYVRNVADKTGMPLQAGLSFDDLVPKTKAGAVDFSDLTPGAAPVAPTAAQQQAKPQQPSLLQQGARVVGDALLPGMGEAITDPQLAMAPVRGLEEAARGIGRTINLAESPAPKTIGTIVGAIPGLEGAQALADAAPHIPRYQGPEATQGISLQGPADPHMVARKLLYGLGESAPAWAGAFIGGPAGAGGAQAVQSFGSYYDDALAKNGGDKALAAKSAAENTAVDSVATALGWKLFEYTPFKKAVGTVTNNITGARATIYEQTVADMIKNLMVQGVALQPAVSVVEHAAHNWIDGRDPREGLPDAYLQGAIPQTLMLGFAHLASPPGPHIGLWRFPNETREAPQPEYPGLPGPTIEGRARPVGPEEPQGPAGPAPRRIGPPPAPEGLEPGTVIGLASPSGIPQRAQVVDHFRDRDGTQFTSVRFDDGTHRDYFTKDVQRDMTEAPPRAEPTEEEHRVPERAPAEPFEMEPYEPPSTYRAPKRQAELGGPQIRALDQANQLEHAALDTGNSIPAATRQDMLAEAARLRRMFGVPAEGPEEEGTPIKRPPLDPDMEAALSDIRQSRAPMPRSPSALDVITAMGGIRTKDADGNVTKEGQDILHSLRDYRRPGLINNQTGLPPDEIRKILQERRWFGARPDQGQDVQELYDLIEREAQGDKVYHPESDTAHLKAVRSQIDEEMTRAGIPNNTDTMTAARMLRDFRLGKGHDEFTGEKEREIDRDLEGLLPEEYRSLKNYGYEPGADLGAEFEAPAGTETHAVRAEPEAGGEAHPIEGTPGAGEHRQPEAERPPAQITEEPGAEGLPQLVIPGAEPTQQQLIKAKTFSERGKGPKEGVAVKPATEGLFKPPKAPPAATGDLLALPEREVTPELAKAEAAAQPEPSQAQIDAGNYQKGHLSFHGLPVTIETPAGAERKGVRPDGTPWSVTLNHPYGYVKGTRGADGDHVDVYIGPHPNSQDVFVVDQIDPATGKFDEHKAVLGVANDAEAKAVYDAGFSDGSGPSRRAAVTPMSMGEFKDWLDSRRTKEPASQELAAREKREEAAPVAQPAKPEADANGNRIFKEGDRVVITEGPHAGRHGVIDKVTSMAWRPMFGSSGTTSVSHYYDIKTDSGATAFGSKFEPETGPAPKFVPDPIVDGTPRPPEDLPHFIGLAKKDIAKYEGMAARAKLPRKKNEWLDLAKKAKGTLDNYTRTLEAWKKAHPEEANRIFAAKAAEPGEVAAQVRGSAEPVPVPPRNDIIVTENEARDGVEVKFKSKPDISTLIKLKGAGFRWSKFQGLWYARRTPKTLEVTNGLKGGEPVKPGEEGKPPAPTTEPSATETDSRAAFRTSLERINNAENSGKTYYVRKSPGGHGWEVLSFETDHPEKLAIALRGEGLSREQALAHAFSMAFPASEEPAALDPRMMEAIRTRLPGRGMPYLTKSGTVDGTPTVMNFYHGWERAKAGREMPPHAADLRSYKAGYDAYHSQPVGSVRAPGEKGWIEIGKNNIGQTLYEDERGVRSYIERGIRYSEPMLLRPQPEGITFIKQRDDHPEFKLASEVTPTEKAEQSANEEAARGELNASEYQPASMPITEAAPKGPRVIINTFTPGDPVEINPATAPLGTEGEKLVTSISEDGNTVTTDGGAEFAPQELQSPQLALTFPEGKPHGLQEPLRPRTPGEEPEALHGAPAEREPGRVPPEEVGGGARAPRPTRGARAEGAGRPAERPPGLPAGAGEGARDHAGLPAAGEGPEPGAARPAGEIAGHDFQIEPGALEEGRGPRQKAADNLAAIELVKRLKAEERPATLDEQKVLAKYVGWGGLKGAFRDSAGKFNKDLEDVGKRLEEVLTPEEHKTAARSVQYAHYTAENVIRAMWSAVARMGFDGGSVFEPGMGIGHFRGMMPPDLAAKSQYQGIEMDGITADIAKLLYPRSGVREADFTRTPIPENSFDLVIGNPPFSDVIVKSDPKYAPRGFMLHDYFFAKSLDSVRPGGVLGFVTSAGTMNKIEPGARQYLAQRAEFLGGVRLPSDAFKRNAGTEVTTDILFFKKRPEPVDNIDAKLEPWVQTSVRELPDAEGGRSKGHVNDYFSQNPDQVLGTEGFFDKLYKGRYAVHARPGVDFEKALDEALKRLPEKVYEPRSAALPIAPTAADFLAPEKKDGSFYIKDGQLWQYQQGAGKPALKRGKGVTGGLSETDRDRIMHLVPMRDALRRVFATDLDEDTEAGIAARKHLNAAYDKFLRKFGPINKVNLQYRRPTIVQQEGARAEAREATRDRGERWLEGEFDATPHYDANKTLAEIAKLRHQARIAAEGAGRKFDEGSFDPEDMPDVVIEKRPNIDPFMDDPESYRLRAIEEYNDATGEHAKRRIFYESVLTKETEPKLESANDGVLWSLNKLGRFDLDKIAEKMGRDRESLIAELGDSVFKVPGTEGTYQMADEYLSGDVKDKLADARRHAESDPAVRRNVGALEAALPTPLAPGQITMRLGMTWIPETYIRDFAQDHLKVGDLHARKSPALGGWVTNEQASDKGPEYAAWSTNDVAAAKLFEHALNRTAPKIYRREKQPDGSTVSYLDAEATQAAADKIDGMKDAFNDWVDQRREELADIYNEAMNRTVSRKWDGSYLTTPGISSDWHWRPHQKRGVARIVQSGNTYIAHAVGAGKTSLAIGAAMEMRRLGLINKPMIVVPNHLLGQFTKEWYEQYPLSKLMVADERRFHTDRRKQFVANVAQSDLDGVIITHSAFEKIPISQKLQAKFINDEIARITEAMEDLDAESDRYTVRQLENYKEKLEQKLSGAFAAGKDMTNTFEELGTDFLFVDEAHMHRKLSFATRQSSLKGIDPEGSNRAWDLFSKIRYLNDQKPGRAAVLMSGTPITNTIGELYTLQRYLQPDELEKHGLSHFDSWAANFGDVKHDTEQTPSGSYERVTRFSRFMNAPELYKMVSQIMDVVTPGQLDEFVVRPKLEGGKRMLHMAPRTPWLDDFQASLGQRVQEIKRRKGPPKKGDDILLSVINDGRHGAIDPRLVEGPNANVPWQDSKLAKLADNVFGIWKKTQDHQFYDPVSNYQKPAFKGAATQMVFANLGINPRTPRGAPENAPAFSVYNWLKRELVNRGVPDGEIAFIKDYKSAVQKQKLFNDMNEGKIRVLVGSTQKMGTGVNAQRRLIAIHNLDPLWFPADDEQRVGRGLRQGNFNPFIQIHDYSTKGTYDSNMWQMMGRKARSIEQFFRGDPNLRNIEDLGEASQYEQASAMSTTDERLIELTNLRQDLEKLRLRESAHEQEQYALKRRIEYQGSSIRETQGNIKRLEGDIKMRVPTQGDKFSMQIGDRTFTERPKAAEALTKVTFPVFEGLDHNQQRPVGKLGGFEVSIYKGPKSFAERGPIFMLKRSDGMFWESPAAAATGAIQSIEHRLRAFDEDLAYQKDTLAREEEALKSMQGQYGKPFPGIDDIKRVREQVRDLEKKLSGEKDQKPEDIQKQIDDNASAYHDGLIDHDTFDANAKRLHEALARAQAKRPSVAEEEPGYAAPPFFSALTRAAEGFRPEKASGEQWAGMIRNAQGVKQDEREWSGVEDWLKEQKGPVTKQALVDFLRENEVKIEEVHKGTPKRQPSALGFGEQREAAHRALAERYEASRRAHERGEDLSHTEMVLLDWLDAHPAASDTEYLTREYDLWLDEHPHLPRMSADELNHDLRALKDSGRRTGPEIDAEMEYLYDFGQRWERAETPVGWREVEAGPGPGEAKWQSYTLPGGQNYREMLLTLPGKGLTEADTAKIARLERENVDLGADYNSLFHGTVTDRNQMPAIALQMQNNTKAIERLRAPQFRSSHWAEPNVLAHVRFDDRTGPNGEKVLHVAEVQSDWGQRLRKTGPRMSSEELQAGLKRLSEEKFRLAREGFRFESPEVQAIERQSEELKDRYVKSTHAPPPMPFKQSWHELAMKRMLRYAAENGYDKLSWDTGDTNADRYDLSKHIDMVEIKKSGDAGPYSVLGYKRGETVFGKHGLKPEDLDDMIGKDLAEKARSQPQPAKRYTGVDLKLGGEGMRGFYDKILPTFVNKYAKKWGAKVEPDLLNREPSGFTLGSFEGPRLSTGLIQRAIERPDFETLPASVQGQVRDALVFASEGAANDEISQHLSPRAAEFLGGKMVDKPTPAVGIPVHSVTITPSMRESVMAGQAMFEPKTPFPTRRHEAVAAIRHGLDLTEQTQRFLWDRNAETPIDQARAISDYLVERGKNTGNEAFVLHDLAAGKILSATTDNSPATCSFDDKLVVDPEAVLVSYHNHPSGRPLSQADLSALYYLPMRWVVARGHNGEWYAASLTPETRQSLADLPALGRQLQLTAAVDAGDKALFKFMASLVKAGRISAETANQQHSHMLALGLEKAGLIDYRSSLPVPPEFAPYVYEAVRLTSKSVERQTRELGTNRNRSRLYDASYRPAKPVRFEEGMAGIFDGLREPAERARNRQGTGQGAGGVGGAGPQGRVAEPEKPYSEDRPPRTAPEGKDYIDETARQLGAEAESGGGGFGTYARRLAGGFKDDRGRPSKFLSGVHGAVERAVILPRTLASTDWRSGKYWAAWQARDQTATRLLHKASEDSASYVALPKAERQKLHAAEELVRLKGLNLVDDGRAVVLRNDLGVTRDDLRGMSAKDLAAKLTESGMAKEDAARVADRIKEGYADTVQRALDQLNPPLAHSRYGDVIALDGKTREAYFDRRKLFAERWRDLMRGAAAKLGWHGSIDPAEILKAAEKAEGAPERRHLERLAGLMQAMAEQERTGYVPFMRFGDYFISVTPKPGVDRSALGGFPYVVNFQLVDSKPAFSQVLKDWTTRYEGEVPEAAKEKMAELRARYGDNYRIEHGYVNRAPERLRSLDIPAVEKLLTILQQRDGELFGPMVQELLDRMYEEMRAGFKRRAMNIPGYDPDFERATGSYLHWTSEHIADQLHGEEVRNAYEQYIDRHPDRGMRDFWKDWAEYQSRPAEKMRALNRLAFYWELAMNPSSSAAIALHGPMVANFVLGSGLGPSKTGLGMATGRLYPALGQVATAIRADAKQGLHLDIDDIKGISDEERKGLKAADKQGTLHSAATEELLGLQQNATDEVEALENVRDAWKRMLKVSASNISVVDRMNRIGIWLAAHRLARVPGVMDKWQRTWGDNQLFREAVERDGLKPETMANFFVDEAAFVWGKRNRPQIARGGIGALVFQFRGFEMNYLSTLWKLMHRMGPAGKVSAAMMLLGLMALSGVNGLPFSTDLEAAYEGLSKAFGHDPMIEMNLKHWMEDHGFGKLGAEMVLKGIPRVAMGVDLSQRLGFGNVVSRNFESNPFAVLGALPGMLYNMGTGAYLRWEHGQPLGAAAQLMPAAVKNPFMAFAVYPKEGVRTSYQTPRQPAVLPPRKVTPWDEAVKSLGFEPTDVSRAYENRQFAERLSQVAREGRRHSARSPEQRIPARARRFYDPYGP